MRIIYIVVKSNFNESKLESAGICWVLSWRSLFVTVRPSALIAVLFQSHSRS